MATQEIAVFGGGCFWCTEAIFVKVKGVLSVMPGYAGGTLPNPTYERVCGGGTGHAEVIRIAYDPGRISYRDLLEIFFATHNPTTMNRQGPDAGEQYRSIILTTSPQQEEAAKQMVGELNAEQAYGKPVVTDIKPLTEFFPAEESHRQYYAKNPDQAYCQAVIAPKLAKFKEKFGALMARES